MWIYSVKGKMQPNTALVTLSITYVLKFGKLVEQAYNFMLLETS